MRLLARRRVIKMMGFLIKNQEALSERSKDLFSSSSERQKYDFILLNAKQNFSVLDRKD